MPSKRERLAAAARLLPYTLARHPALLRLRLYGRAFWIAPSRIAGKPAAPDGWDAARAADIALLERMRAAVVVDGDWDLEPRPFAMSPVIDELFVQRIPREETPSFRRMVRAVHEGDRLRSRNCRTVAEVHERFDRIDALYATIARDGFRSQRELGHPPEDEVTVCVGRDGSVLLLRFGNHRTSIARAAGVPRMAVRVVGVHAGWVAARQAEHGDRNVVRATEQGLARLLAE